jgi:hypothetical protein
MLGKPNFAPVLRIRIFPSIIKSESLTLIKKKSNFPHIIFKEIESGAVAKSYKRKGFLRYEEMLKYFPIHEEAVSHI